MGLWNILNRHFLASFVLVVLSGQIAAQTSPFHTAINALPCARNLTVTDLSTTPMADVASKLRALSFATWQGQELTPELSERLVSLFGEIERYAAGERQTGGSSSGLANALAAFGATLDANAWLGSTDMLLSMTNVAAILFEQNCREDAIRWIDEALPNARSLFADPDTRHYLIAALQVRAPALTESGRLGEALATYVELEGVLKDAGAFPQREQLEVAVRVNRAIVLRRMGRLAEAERVVNDAVKMASDRFGPDSNEAGFALNALAVFYSAIGAPVDLEPIYDQIINIRLKQLGDKKFDTAVSFQNRGQWRRSNGDADGAIADFEEALKIIDRAGLARSDRALTIRSRLALLKAALGRTYEAEVEFAAADAMSREISGLSPLRLAQFLHEYGLFLTQTRPSEAVGYFSQAIDLRLQHLGPAHPFLAESYANRANAQLASNASPRVVYSDFRAASEVYRTWLAVEASRCRAGNPPLGSAVKETVASAILTATFLSQDLSGDDRGEILSDVVQMIQIAAANDVSHALSQLTRRNGEMESLRVYQETLRRSCAIESEIQRLRAASASEEAEGALATALTTLTDLDQQLAILALEIEPSLVEGVASAEKILDIEALLRFLEPGDAAVVFLMLDNFFLRVDIERLEDSLTINSFANINMGGRDIQELVAALNASIASQTFDAELASKIHEALFEEFRVTGNGQVYIVPDGGIDRLSFSVLMDSEGLWFANKFTHSVIPSLASLAQLDQLEDSKRPPGFLGIGDPTLSLTGGNCVVGGDEETAASQLGKFLTGNRGAIAAEDVRELCSLSFAAAELRAISDIVGDGQANLLMGAAATERALREFDFSKTGVLSFATHGLMAGAALDLPEPALILTPIGDGGDVRDDGVLLASDIANLALDNVWLATLSACDTSAGAVNGEGLSGIGRAFLFAGVETLLVSHWAVDDAATKELLVAFFAELYGDDHPSVSKSLQRAMSTLRRTNPDPYLWGAFAIVGDGALTRPDDNQ